MMQLLFQKATSLDAPYFNLLIINPKVSSIKKLISFFIIFIYALNHQIFIMSSYCNTCFKTGKSQKEYTSHNTKEKRGHNFVVVCPTILDTKCNACNQFGHMANPKFCPLLKRQEKERELQKRLTKENNKINKKVIPNNFNNIFLVLDKEEDYQKAIEPKVPKVSSILPKVSSILCSIETPIKGLSYAQIAEKPPDISNKPLKRKWTDSYYDESSDEEDDIDYSQFDSTNDAYYDEWKINC